MENQHKKITGYRDLTQGEIDLMNEVKRMGEKLDDLLHKVGAHLHAQYSNAHESIAKNDDFDESQRIENAQPGRWVAMARTDFQTGLMCLSRAIAQPSSF